MRDAFDEQGEPLPDTQRLTRVGKRVRAWSLDELLQLINVLKGEMSFVGPRPLLVTYLPLYNSEQAHRHDVKPGITGWAQVNGRNAISWPKKFALDLYYVNNLSFLLDVRILFLTIQKVFLRSNINASMETPMEPFLGNTSAE
jgi:lipopolysaccharide/colanic/teichoic acid biosynthesis glycosyltransferase